jgi:hypothetical protein
LISSTNEFAKNPVCEVPTAEQVHGVLFLIFWRITAQKNSIWVISV